jgi:hypothetical protein
MVVRIGDVSIYGSDIREVMEKKNGDYPVSALHQSLYMGSPVSAHGIPSLRARRLPSLRTYDMYSSSIMDDKDILIYRIFFTPTL